MAHANVQFVKRCGRKEASHTSTDISETIRVYGLTTSHAIFENNNRSTHKTGYIFLLCNLLQHKTYAAFMEYNLTEIVQLNFFIITITEQYNNTSAADLPLFIVQYAHKRFTAKYALLKSISIMISKENFVLV